MMMTLSLSSFAGKTIQGNGNLIKREISIADYNEIELELNANVNYTQSDAAPFCQFTIDENLLEYIDIYVKEGELHIALKKEYRQRSLDINPTDFTIITSSTQLNDIGIAGSGEVNIIGNFRADNLEAEIAGSGTIGILDAARIASLDVEIDGSGKVFLKSGAAVAEASVEISGSGNFDADNSEISELSCEIAGSGTINAKVIDRLEYEIAGSGIIRYSGTPSIKGDVAGSGKLIKQ